MAKVGLNHGLVLKKNDPDLILIRTPECFRDFTINLVLGSKTKNCFGVLLS